MRMTSPRQKPTATWICSHPWAITSEESLAKWRRHAKPPRSRRTAASPTAKAQAFRPSKAISSAPTRGFRGGYASSRHSFSVAPIASLPGKNGEMQRDAWYSPCATRPTSASPEAVGRYAAQRALMPPGSFARSPPHNALCCLNRPWPQACWAVLCQAVSGGSLYRKSGFLLDSLGKMVFPKRIDILEDPFILGGKGSSPFDEEGVRVAPRKVVQGGRVQGYFLSSYSARRLGMKTTGNAGGSHNLVMTSRLTQASDDLDAMLQKLGTGLFVVELMGQGVNYVTGDYSRGASGFWVENGKIAFPVHEITIAGNLKDMLKGIEAVGADAYSYGAETVSSILVNRMKVAGS